jgi:hypothetical protein
MLISTRVTHLPVSAAPSSMAVKSALVFGKRGELRGKRIGNVSVGALKMWRSTMITQMMNMNKIQAIGVMKTPLTK